MLIGVTGTRSGMNTAQREAVLKFLSQAYDLDAPNELHHGDCVGVDAEVADMARGIGYTIVCHPPEIDDLRAFTKYDMVHEPQTYFARNRRIVNECDILVVVPYQNSHQRTGGTWYTHDYAVKFKKPVHVIYPGENNEI